MVPVTLRFIDDFRFNIHASYQSHCLPLIPFDMPFDHTGNTVPHPQPDRPIKMIPIRNKNPQTGYALI